MAYNKAKGGGVPIKGNSSTSSIHNPKEGSVDQPQDLGGSVMGLGPVGDSELIGSISPGAGAKGGGLHEPIIKDDSAKAVGVRSINPKYNTIRTIIGSSGAVAAGGTRYTSFVASFGAGADIDGTPFPSEQGEGFEPCDKAAMNARWDYDYLPDDCECCDTMDKGPCKFVFKIPILGDIPLHIGSIDPVLHKCTLLDLIKSCIDHTKTYSNGDPIVWAEPAALNLLRNSEYVWDNPFNYTWNGNKFTFNNVLAGSFGISGGKMDDEEKYLGSNDCKWWEKKDGFHEDLFMDGTAERRANLCHVDTDPDADWSTAAGSDLDKVMKHAVKHYYFDAPVGGGTYGKLDKVRAVDGDANYELIKILDSSGKLDGEDVASGSGVSPVRPRWWGGARQNHYFRITIESKEEITEEQDMGGYTSPIPVGDKVIFKWGHTSNHPCQSPATLSNTVTVNAYKNNGTWVDAPRGSGFDSRGRETNYWTVNLLNNVWAYIHPDSIHVGGETFEYEISIPEYSPVQGDHIVGVGLNVMRCIAPDDRPEGCGCGMTWVNREQSPCECWPALYDIPEVINNTNFEDFDSAWPYIREAHKVSTIKDSCKCASDACGKILPLIRLGRMGALG